MSDLTGAQQELILALVRNHPVWKTAAELLTFGEEMYHHGLGAGRARAIEECGKVCDEFIHADKCAAAIRALLTPAQT